MVYMDKVIWMCVCGIVCQEQILKIICVGFGLYFAF